MVAFNVAKYLKVGGFIGLVMGDIWHESEVYPLGVLCARDISQAIGGKLKAIAVKNIRGNRPGPGYHLRLSRYAKWGALDFKHEYMTSIQKVVELDDCNSRE